MKTTIEKNNEQIENLTAELECLSGLLAGQYPDLTDYECLKLTMEILKNNTLNNIHETLNEISVGIQENGNVIGDVAINLTEIE